MNKVYAILGGIGGIFTSFFLYMYLTLELYTSREYNLLYRLSSPVILFITVLFAIIAIKKLNGNRISFMRCMFTGFIISIIAGLVQFAFYTTFYFARPEIIAKAEKISEQQFMADKEIKTLPADQQAQKLQRLQSQFKPGGTLLSTVFTFFLICMIEAVIIAAFAHTRSEESL